MVIACMSILGYRIQTEIWDTTRKTGVYPCPQLALVGPTILSVGVILSSYISNGLHQDREPDHLF